MAAGDGAARTRPEWPPHPDRLFMAMAAAWFETGEAKGEGDVLRWFETLHPPNIVASDYKERTLVTSYVPVNDVRISKKIPKSKADLKKLKENGLAQLPQYRKRQEQHFPVAVPKDTTVYMIWRDVDLGTYKDELVSLTSKITHIGHSASFVQVWVAGNIEQHPMLVPNDRMQGYNLRMFAPGRLDTLIRLYNKEKITQYTTCQKQLDDLKKNKASSNEIKNLKKTIQDIFGDNMPVTLRPTPVLFQKYSRPSKPTIAKNPQAVFDPNLIIFTIKNNRFPLTMTLNIIQSMRKCIMKYCNDSIPEWISGHAIDGTFTTKPHMAIFPAPFVGSKYADGRIMGVIIAVPAGIDKKEIERSLGKILYDENGPRTHTLFDGKWFECKIELEVREDPPISLQSSTWTRASRTWASVTPITLNHHFKGKDRWDKASESLKDACERIGLPRPSKVLAHSASLVYGAPHSRDYPRITRKVDNGTIAHSHAVVIFDEPVQGPVIIGAGRFRGYGLCRPMDE